MVLNRLAKMFFKICSRYYIFWCLLRIMLINIYTFKSVGENVFVSFVVNHILLASSDMGMFRFLPNLNLREASFVFEIEII